MTVDTTGLHTNIDDGISEFLPSTQDVDPQYKIDKSKAAKYKKPQQEKQHEIIVFPDVRNNKTTNNSAPQTSKDTDGLKNSLY